MKRSRFTEEQIVHAITQVDAGVPVKDLCRKYGISTKTFYTWRKKFGGLGSQELRELRQLREENRKLKGLVADLSLDKQILKDALFKKALTPARKRELVHNTRERFVISIQRACGLFDLQRSTFYKRSTADPQLALRQRIRELAEDRPRFGYRRIHVLLQREGWVVGHKRVHRLYRLEGLNLRIRRRNRRATAVRVPPPPATAPNECWSVDFVSDALGDGRRFRALTVIDNHTRVCTAIAVAHSLPSSSVTEALDKAISTFGRPAVIRLDNGPEFTSSLFDAWAYRRRVRLDFITPGKPTQNGLIESFNGKLRDECLSASWFESLEDAKQVIESWRLDYNEERPHSALAGLAPSQYLADLITEGQG
ncbi:MAG: IS3 family transposase [bacterium]|nr:IS3 family transposase [bacterium]